MPRNPAEVPEKEDRFSHTLGYYAALQSFLTYSFGWTRPDRGLATWLARGTSAPDARLDLIDATWGKDRTLIGFLGWLLTQTPHSLARDTLRPWARSINDRPLTPDVQLNKLLRSAKTGSLWEGGSDPLHLGGGSHIAAPSEPLRHAHASRLTGVTPERRTAIYICDTISGWYHGLNDAGRRLPDLVDGRHWSVDVFVKPIGFLGTYRQSDSTGLWFSGSHRVHMSGN